MIDIIGGLIVFYLVFRLLTTFIIPKVTQFKINRYKEKLKKENPRLFENKTKYYTGKLHPSIRKYYKDEDKEDNNK
ncbi:MAG: hypothetical protein H6Q15_372 [Bacteroidetes bacterium]|nr:hypothetical protein [Bacteroidota bacterium]